MVDFDIMANHVHLLASFATPETMEKQFDSWSHFAVVRSCAWIESKDRFWQQEPFDHFVHIIEPTHSASLDCQ